MLAYTHNKTHHVFIHSQGQAHMTLQDSVGSSTDLLSSSGREVRGIHNDDIQCMYISNILSCGVALHPIGAGHEFVT